MKQRVLTGCVIAVFFAVLMACMYTPIFEILIAVLAATAVYEILKVAKVKNLPMIVISIAFSAMIPLSYIGYDMNGKFAKVLILLRENSAVCLILYIIAVLIIMLARYHKTRFEHAAMCVFASICVPYAFSVLMMLRDINKLPEYSQKSAGIFFILFSFSCSWLTDMFAYFTGRAFGKHKLCPNISPKKTVEGAVGGTVITMALNLLLLFIFNKFFFAEFVIHYLFIAVLSIVLSVVSMFGDLSASTIKRNFGIKDFGKILPGHGGIMDRFDSCLFVWPCLYAILKTISLIMEY